MKLHVVAPRQGAVWVRRGFQMLMRQPLGYAALFATCLFALLAFGLMPLLGSIAFSVLPIAALLFMIASRRVEAGLAPLPGAFVEFGRSGRPVLVGLATLAVVCGLSVLGVLWIGNIIDGGALEALQKSMLAADELQAPPADTALRGGLIARLALLLLISVPAWHAPALVCWGGQSWFKALVFSAVACWRNKAAFAVYAACWLGVWMLMAMLVSLTVALVGQAHAAAVVVPLSLAFWTAVGASLYFTFADCFEPVPLPPEAKPA